MSDELRRIWKKVVAACLKYYPDIFLVDWGKPWKYECRQHPDQD